MTKKDEEYLKTQIEESIHNINLLRTGLHDITRRQDVFQSSVQNIERSNQQLNSQVTLLENSIREVQQWKTNLEDSFEDIIRNSSAVTAYFHNLKWDFLELREEWKVKESSRAAKLISKILNIKEELDEHTVINSCYVADDQVHFNLNRTNVLTDIQILQANPFNFYQTSTTSQIGIKLEYVGPEYVLYNSSSHCVTPYNNPNRNLPIVPTPGDCTAKNSASAAKYWRKSCIVLPPLDESSIQIKPVEDHLFVYCFGHTITIFKKTMNCPPFVFSVHQNESMSIEVDGISMEVGKIMHPVIKQLKSSSEHLSNKVTNILMPNLIKMFPNDPNFLGQCSTSTSNGSMGSSDENSNANFEQSWGNQVAGKTTESESGPNSTLTLGLAVGALIVAIIALCLCVYSIVQINKLGAVQRADQPYQLPMLQSNPDYR
jgi:hypothetical protein